MLRLTDPGQRTATIYRIQHCDKDGRWSFSNTDLMPYEVTRGLNDGWQITAIDGWLDFKEAQKRLRIWRARLKLDGGCKDTRGEPYFKGVKQWRLVKQTICVQIEVVKRKSRRSQEER